MAPFSLEKIKVVYPCLRDVEGNEERVGQVVIPRETLSDSLICPAGQVHLPLQAACSEGR